MFAERLFCFDHIQSAAFATMSFSAQEIETRKLDIHLNRLPLISIQFDRFYSNLDHYSGINQVRCLALVVNPVQVFGLHT
jgi:hypothetical protein